MIEVSAQINRSIEHVWNTWVSPEHIVKWNFASPDWCCPKASVDLNVGGKFSYTMASKDGNHQFDFLGTYKKIDTLSRLEIELEDKRQLIVLFEDHGDSVLITEQFEPETQNEVELQRMGWQAILNEFKSYVEREIQ
jgi:uncharacterized protein YndB with AHSA1/START domain